MIYLQFLTIYTQTNPFVVFSVTLFAMLPQVAHGLGLGYTVDKNSIVREALKDTYTSIEEGKAGILGLWSVYQLNEMGAWTKRYDGQLCNIYGRYFQVGSFW